MDVCGEIKTVDQLDATQRHQMFQLMQHYFKDMNRAQFEHDLFDKQWVIILKAENSDTLCGFSTQKIFEHHLNGNQKIKVLFSGDTIVHRHYWQSNPLAGVWGKMVMELIAQTSNMPLYWFLLSQGFRTYRYLPLFFHEFYPNHTQALPPAILKIIDSLASASFSNAYVRESGIVRAGHYRLRGGISDVKAAHSKNVHIRYYLQQNPGHVRGDELCCLVPLTYQNFKPAAHRVIEGVKN